jgi:hypothetical protein
MSYMSYNEVPMEVESFQRFDQMSVYSDDGADYLYTQFTIVVRCLWHPRGVAFGAPPVNETQSAAQSMQALRATLMKPRKTLIIKAPHLGTSTAGNTFLRSPLLRPPPFVEGTAYPVDAKNGPQPLFCNIVQIVGEDTMIVDFGIITWINECVGTAENPTNPVLSHRWSQAHYIDEMQHTRRIVTGVAVLRTDLLYNQNGAIIVHADDFREHFFHNVPPNFRRVAVNVNASSDGSRLEYVVEDQEVDGVIDPEIFSKAEVADIDGVYSETVEAATGGEAFLRGTTLGALNGARGANTFGGIAGGGWQGALAGAAQGAMQNLGGLFPTRTHEVFVRVQGTRRSTRAGLVQVAIRAVLGFRIGTLGQPSTAVASNVIRNIIENFFVTSSIQVGLVNKWVTLRLSYKAGGVSSIVHQAVGFAQRAADVAPAINLFDPGGVAVNVLNGLRALFGNPANSGNNQTSVYTAISDTPGSVLPVSAFSPNFPDFLPGVTKTFGTVADSYGPRGGSLMVTNQAGSTINIAEKGSRGATIAHLLTAAFNEPCEAPDPPQPATTNWNSPVLQNNRSRM